MTNVAMFHHCHLDMRFGTLLITNFLELGVVAGISRTRASLMPFHAVNMPRPCHYPAMVLRSRFQKQIFVAWQGNGMVRVNQTRPHCVNQMGKAQFKPLAERHGNGRGMAGEPQGTVWSQHGNGMVCVNPPLQCQLP
jgi:hypothetical protein